MKSLLVLISAMFFFVLTSHAQTQTQKADTALNQGLRTLKTGLGVGEVVIGSFKKPKNVAVINVPNASYGKLHEIRDGIKNCSRNVANAEIDGQTIKITFKGSLDDLLGAAVKKNLFTMENVQSNKDGVVTLAL